ncbi:MAG: hypothetical protein R2878_05490 [Thermoleophilia bacterium]
MDSDRTGGNVIDPGTAAPRSPDAPDAHVHDVVNLDAGHIASTPLRRAPANASRTRLLAEAGLHTDAVTAPVRTHRLTPRRPFQTSPAGWLDAFEGTYGTGPGVDEVWWRLPASFPTEFWPGVNFTFKGSGAGSRLLSLSYRAYPYAGHTGTVVIDIGAKRTEIPISGPVTRTTDIAFDHPGGLVDARVFFRAGLIDFVWKVAALSRRSA